MPFTFAHPGFTLPFKKWKPAWLSTTGLVFGSIAPDMDILLRLTNPRFHIFQYDLKCVFLNIFPIALLFSIYFHLVMRNILIDHLPRALYDRCEPYKNFQYLQFLKANILRVIISIFLAIYLHLFLDMISHWNAAAFRVYGGMMYQSLIVSLVYYYISIYVPALIFTIVGFYLLLHYNKLALKDISGSTWAALRDPEKIAFYILFILLAVLIAFVKTFFTGIEKSFPADSLIINLTNGCMISGILTPTLFFLRNKLFKVS
jgi:hypothetical protein